MVDYTEKLRQDLLEQFKEKPVIDALICAVGEQLTDLHRGLRCSTEASARTS